MTEATVVQPTNQNELLRILATIVLAASFFLGSWWMAKEGWLDAAAMFLTMFVVGFGKDRIERGLIKTPGMVGRKVPDTPKEMTGSFRNVRWFLLSIYEGGEEWRDKSPNLRPMIWCAGFAALWVAMKFGVVQLLTVMTNPALIILIGGSLIAFLLAPGYFGGLIRKFQADKKQADKKPVAEGGEQ